MLGVKGFRAFRFWDLGFGFSRRAQVYQQDLQIFLPEAHYGICLKHGDFKIDSQILSSLLWGPPKGTPNQHKNLSSS